MLYSAKNNIAFAHYPKTAGTSVSAWFKATFQDAVYIEPNPTYEISHYDVKKSLQHLKPNPKWHERILDKIFDNKFQIDSTIDSLRIIGVLRDPFDMLVSLYEYWRNIDRSQFKEPKLIPLIIAAREESFTHFLALALDKHPVVSYRDFFDVGGVCWPKTRLLAFECIDQALIEVCSEFNLPAPKKILKILNPNPKTIHSIQPYLRQAGSLVNHVEQHFHWYYNEGQKIMVSK